MNLLYENSWILFLQRIWMLFCRQWTWSDSNGFARGEQQLKSQLLLLFLSPAELIGVCLIHTVVQRQLGMWAEITHRLQDPSLGLSLFLGPTLTPWWHWLILLSPQSRETAVSVLVSLCWPEPYWNCDLPSGPSLKHRKVTQCCLLSLSFSSFLKHTCFYLFSRTLC